MLLILKGELEEYLAELEEVGRKLVTLQMEIDTAYGVHNVAPPVSANGSMSPVKPANKTMDLEELKESVEEAKVYQLYGLPLQQSSFFVLVTCITC